MWGGRGAVLRPRGVRWRSVAPGVKKYTKTDVVVRSHLDIIITITTTEQHYVVHEGMLVPGIVLRANANF